MLELQYKEQVLSVKDSNGTSLDFDTENNTVSLWWLDINYSWEYEKSGILVEVKHYAGSLYYNFLIEGKRLVIIPNDSFELKEEILTFFWDVDILIIVWTKSAAKLFENIEAKLVVPYGEWKDIFLNTLGQKIEEAKSYKIKWEFSIDSTDFVNLV